jgi:hypothetical protein
VTIELAAAVVDFTQLPLWVRLADRIESASVQKESPSSGTSLSRSTTQPQQRWKPAAGTIMRMIELGVTITDTAASTSGAA